MARCKRCEDPIVWARVSTDGPWHRPLEVASVPRGLFQVDGGVVKPVDPNIRLYRVHTCDPDKVEQVEEERQMFFEGSHTHLDVSVACPRCGAPAGERCFPLTPTYKYGNHLQCPHPARIKAAQEAQKGKASD